MQTIPLSDARGRLADVLDRVAQAQGVAWLQQAAAQGHPQAKSLLSKLGQ